MKEFVSMTLDGYEFSRPVTVMLRAGGDWVYAREPVLRRMPDGSLVALSLSGGPTEPHDDNLVLIVRSEDEGRTWAAPVATGIPDANSKVTLLRHGEAVFMLHNPSAETGWSKRSSLELWVSHDGCRTWPVRMVLARAVERDRVICYPHGFVEPRSGQLHVAMDTAVAHYYMSVPLSDVLG